MSVTVEDMSAELQKQPPAPQEPVVKETQPVEPSQPTLDEVTASQPQPEPVGVSEGEVTPEPVGVYEGDATPVPVQSEMAIPPEMQSPAEVPPQDMPFIPGISAAQASPSPTDLPAPEEKPLLPNLLPSFSELSQNPDLLTGDTLEEKLQNAKLEVSDAYARGVLFTGDQEKDDKRRAAIMNATEIRIPVIRNGQVVKDKRGVIMTSDKLEFEPEDSFEDRLILMFEAMKSPNGVYHLYDANTNKLNSIDLTTAIAQYTQPRQEMAILGPLTRFFFRAESASGGLDFYNEYLKDRNVKDPYKRLYYLRQQAKDGPFLPIAHSRLDAAAMDLYPGLANLGMMGVDFAADFTVAGPMTTSAMLMDSYNWITGQDGKLIDQNGEPLAYQDFVKTMLPAMERMAKSYEVLPQFVLFSHRQAKSLGVSVEEAEAIYDYSSDFFDIGQRFTVESMAAAPTSFYGVQALRVKASKEFGAFVVSYFGNEIRAALAKQAKREVKKGNVTEGWKISEQVKRDFTSKAGTARDRLWTDDIDSLDYGDWQVISDVLDKKGIGFTEAFDIYIRETNKKASRGFIERALALDLQRQTAIDGPLKDAFMEGQAEILGTRLNEVRVKISKELDRGDKANPDRLEVLRKQESLVSKQLTDLKGESFIDPAWREFFKDETGALIASAGAFTLVANVTPDPLSQAAAAFFGVGLSVHPKVRRGARYLYEDAKWAIGKGFGNPPSRHAIHLRRQLEKAPPGLRDQVLLHIDSRIQMNEQLRELKYPDGTQVISEESLKTSFSGMGVLIGLENLKQQALQRGLNVRTDMGGLSKTFAKVEDNLQEQVVQLDEMAESIRQLRNYRLDASLYDPNTELGKNVDMVLKFYDQRKAAVAAQREELAQQLNLKEGLFNSLIDGLQDQKTVEAFMSGERSLQEAIAIDLVRFRLTQIPEDATADEQAVLLQEHLTTLQESFAEAAELQLRVTNAQRANGTANKQFGRIVKQQEHIGYVQANNGFEKLRYDFADARFDITGRYETIDGQETSVFDQVIAGQIELDEDAVALIPVLTQGGHKDRTFAGLSLSAGTLETLEKLVGRAATEYLDRAELNPRIAEYNSKLLAGAELQDASDVEKFIFLRATHNNGYSRLKARYDALISDVDADPEEVQAIEAKLRNYEEMEPVLGLTPDEFMHMVSGLGRRSSAQAGKTGAVPVAQLRENLLAAGNTNFYTNFYGPKSQREAVDFGGAYQSAREGYDKYYLTPFRKDSTSVKRFLNLSEAGQETKMKFFESFGKEFLMNRRLTDVEIEEGPMKVLIDMNGGQPIDINSPYGRQLRVMLTQLAMETLGNTLGGKEFFNVAQGLSPNRRLNPKQAEEFLKLQTQMKEGLLQGESGINLSNIYALKDKDGNPLVDFATIDYAYSLDHLEKIAPDMVRTAKSNVAEGIKVRKDAYLKQFDDATNGERQRLDLRINMTSQLKAKEGGLGRAFYDMVQSENGVATFKSMREVYIQREVQQKGPQIRERAAYNFDRTVREAVEEYVFEIVTNPGQNRTVIRTDARGNQEKIVVRGKEVDATNLFDVLGYVGETADQLDTRKQSVIKMLLRDNTLENPDAHYDHILLVAQSLYSPSAKQGFNVTGIAMPVSAESKLSKITSYMRGVISLRWLASEAAIREALASQMELTRILLFDPDVGNDLLRIIETEDFTVERFARVEEVLLNAIARNDAIREYATRSREEEEQSPISAAGIQRGIQAVGTGAATVASQAQNMAGQITSLFGGSN